MAMLHTKQSGYIDLLVDVTSENDIGDVTYRILDGSTAGHTFDFSDMPAHAIGLQPEDNAAIVYVYCTDTSADYDFGLQVYGYAANGPAEMIADVSGLIGTACIGDNTKSLYADTMTVTSYGVKTASAVDSGNNQVAKLVFDTAGLSYLCADFYDISGTDEALHGASGTINAKVRFF